MDFELDPPQPEPVVRSVAALLGDDEARIDPWWAAGLEEAHGASTAEGADARHGGVQGEAIARPRRTRGAERA